MPCIIDGCTYLSPAEACKILGDLTGTRMAQLEAEGYLVAFRTPLGRLYTAESVEAERKRRIAALERRIQSLGGTAG